MEGKNVITTFSAARIVASVFGMLAGLGGITHGIGEVLQGNVAPDGIWIYSWTQGPIASKWGASQVSPSSLTSWQLEFSH